MKKLTQNIIISNILKGARDIVERRWAQGSYWRNNKTGEEYRFGGTTPGMGFGVPDDDSDDYDYCGDGALRRALKDALKARETIQRWKQEKLLHESQKTLSKAIIKRAGASFEPINEASHPERDIWCFNDMDTTTKDMMLAAFDDAIEDQCNIVKRLIEDEKLPQEGEGSGVEEGERPV